MVETETIDKLFLELSQVTKATTKRELDLQAELVKWKHYADYCRNCAVSGEKTVKTFKQFIGNGKRHPRGVVVK